MRPVFDRDGLLVAWLEDDASLYDAVGMPIAYLDRDRVYSYGGAFLGWFTDGWFRDRTGSAAGFLEGSTGSADLPAVANHRPRAPSTFVRPAKSSRENAPATPTTRAEWVPWHEILG